MLPFKLPPPLNFASAPDWIGNGFRLGEEIVPVVEYSENFDGWSDDLTALHEDAAGDSHPIDIASRDDALKQLRTYLTSPTPTILEIGCSSGFMLKAMKREFPRATIVGADVVREPLYRLAKELSIPLLRFDLLQCPLPSESFDAVVMLNVLEHIDNDEAALVQAHRILKPDGIIIIEVPSGPHLYDAYDKALMHFRRYDIRDLTDKLKNAGFRVLRQSHLGFFLYPAFVIVKRRNQRMLGDAALDVIVRNQASDTSSSYLLRAAVFIEKQLSKWLSFPKGIRCLVVARKK
jgi:SAM-dependent methyltransferase